MPSIEIKQLYNFNRLPENETKIFFILLYLPIGIILVTLRAILLFFVLILGHLSPDSEITNSCIRKLTCLGLGITVNVENPVEFENVEVYVTNSRSILDPFAIHIATGAVSPLSKLALEKITFLRKHKFGCITNAEDLKKKLEDFMQKNTKIPLCFSPESKITNGKALLKFQSYPFEFVSKVQPICIRIERPILNMSVNTFKASVLKDIFFYLLSPLTIYKLKFLAPLEKKSLSAEEFTEIVRQNIAVELKVEKTNFNSSDLLEWEKRRSQVNRTVTPRSRRNIEFQRMATQVKEVMPQVPYNIIYDDICSTESVDSTITNILEGRLQFDPEVPGNPKLLQNLDGPTNTGSVQSAESSSTSSHFNTAAKTFPKSASERSKSFQERKEQLVAAARRRYIEKHNLDVPS